MWRVLVGRLQPLGLDTHRRTGYGSTVQRCHELGNAWRDLYGSVLMRRTVHVTFIRDVGEEYGARCSCSSQQSHGCTTHTALLQGGVPMHTQHVYSRLAAGLSRRELLHMGLAAGLTVSALPLSCPAPLWGAEVSQPKRGGTLHVRGYDPVHFDHHLTSNARTNTTLSFVHSTLLRYKVGPEITPGTFTVEPHLAERWEAPDDLTYVFHLRQGVKWHNRPPLNGRELVAEDVKFTFDRFLNEKANVLRETLEPVERVEAVDRYTVKFVLK